MIDLRALFYGLAGAARLVRLDRSGAHMMVGGPAGFWAALYWSMSIVAPLFLLLMLLRFDPQKYDGLRFLLVHTEVYVLSWLAFPLLMERICHYINRSQYFVDFIIAYTWLSCLYNIFYLLVGLAQASGMISWEAASAMSVGLMVAGLVWIGNLCVATLKIPASAAVGIVVMEMFLSIMISLLSAALVSQ